MNDQDNSKEISEIRDTTSESRPAMCGTFLLWMGADKMKQLQQNKSQESLERESLESEPKVASE